VEQREGKKGPYLRDGGKKEIQGKFQEQEKTKKKVSKMDGELV